MKVKQLIKELSGIDENTEIVMSKDGEGNDFSPLSDISLGHYEADCTWSGQYYDDDEKTEKSIKAICLWPTN